MKNILVILCFVSLGIASANSSIYANKCASCHGAKGEATAYNKTKPIAGQEASLTYQQLNGYKNGSLNMYGFGSIMKNMVNGLDDGSMKELSVYISKLK